MIEARAQQTLILLSIALYPALILVGGAGWAVLAAPLAAGGLMAIASALGPKPYCPVKLGVVAGLLGAIASIIMGASYHIGYPGVLAGYLGVNGIEGLALEIVYHATTTPALGGASLLLLWKLKPANDKIH